MKTRLLTLLSLVALIVAACAAHAGDLRGRAEAFNRAYTGATLKLQPDGRSVRTISGFATRPLAGDPETAARSFAESWGDMLGLAQGSELRFVSTRPGASRRIVVFQQYHRGIPVYRSRLSITVDEANRVTRATSSLQPSISVPVSPSVSEGQALALVRERYAEGLASAPPVREEAWLVILDHNGQPRLAWVVNPVTKVPALNMYYFIDATTGSLIRQENRVVR